MEVRPPKSAREGGVAYYRYYLVEADGHCYEGYTQRPAAMRNAERAGMGVYDAREKILIHAPDKEKRLRQLQSSIDYHRAEADKFWQRRHRVEQTA